MTAPPILTIGRPLRSPSGLLWSDDTAQRLFAQYPALPYELDIRKIQPFLDQLDAARIPVKYCALDISDVSLTWNLSKLNAAGYKHVECPTFYISLGSVFANDEFDIAVWDLWE
ncbi:hypothetical protein VTI74DRAFT_11581 [Chaetomium olivicolor]